MVNQIEVEEYVGPEPLGPLEAKITVRDDVQEDAVDDRSLMLGVSGMDTESFASNMEEQLKKNMYIGA